MPWLYLLLAAAAFAAAFKTASVLLLSVALLAGLVLMLASMTGFLAARVDGRSGNAALLIDPAEVRRLREQTEARREAMAGPGPETLRDATAPDDLG